MFVLGIDQARRSGWCIHTGDVGACRTAVLASGFVLDTGGIMGVVAMVKSMAGAEPYLAVFEDHSGIPLHNKTRFARGHGAPQRNTATILGIGAARGRWEVALDLAEHPDSLRVSVEPCDWRGRVLGLLSSANPDRCKAVAVEYASRLIGHAVTDHNEAEAVCIACWGALDGKAQLDAAKRERNMRARMVRAQKKQGGLPW